MIYLSEQFSDMVDNILRNQSTLLPGFSFALAEKSGISEDTQ